MTEHNKIKANSKNDQVFEFIREEILTGRMGPGVIYSAASLAESLDVSRTPVNYAIRLLLDQGLIKAHPNVGFEVIPLEWDRIEELMQIKSAMERLCILRMKDRVHPSDIDTLLEYSQRIRQSIIDEDDQAYFQFVKDLHWGICSAGKSRLCLDFSQRYWDYEGWYTVKMDEHKEQLLSMCDDHDMILNCINKGDYETAVSICESHHVKCLDLLKSNLNPAMISS